MTGSLPIRAAGARDAALFADILTEALADDPLLLWMFGRAERARRGHVALARYCLREGFGSIAADGAGAALWLPPRPEGAPAGLAALGASLDFAARTLAGGGLRAAARSEEVGRAAQAMRPAGPHYHLVALGVRPGRRGQGLGAALMAPGLARCDAEDALAHLECTTREALAFYRRLGFEPTGALPLPPGAPEVWAMQRAPRRG